MQAEDSNSRSLVYGGGSGSKGGAKKFPQGVTQSLFVGGDVIPGLIERTTAEIGRLRQADNALGQRAAALSGDDLLEFMFGTLFRAQVMIPNSADLSQAEFELSGGKKLGAASASAGDSKNDAVADLKDSNSDDSLVANMSFNQIQTECQKRSIAFHADRWNHGDLPHRLAYQSAKREQLANAIAGKQIWGLIRESGFGGVAEVYKQLPNMKPSAGY